ncbi:S49 family peptidase, partial [Accumulibacter sp.]|uniref:S49 family peptidase n=1 Tax=Accumulibacter sp. TaxID=2053492 RepID=UPI002613DA91
MNAQLLDVLSVPWAIHEPNLLEIQAIAARLAGGDADIAALETKLGRPLDNSRAVTMRGDTALIPVVGPIFRYANLFSKVSGATSLAVLATDFASAESNPKVKQIVLVIDSPGGQASGIAEFAQTIRAATKPVIAYIDNTAASAAYWLASAAGLIVMAKTAMVGSIGAVVTIGARKTDGQVEIISSQSPHKRADVTTDSGRAQIQVLIDGLAQVFVEDVAAYRHVSVDTVLRRFGGGGMKLAAEAVALGMADRVGTIETLLADLAGTTIPTHIRQEAPKMLPASHPTADDRQALHERAKRYQADHPGTEYMAAIQAIAGPSSAAPHAPVKTPCIEPADDRQALHERAKRYQAD